MRCHPVPEPFRDPDDLRAMVNFTGYRFAIATSDKQRDFWSRAFEKFREEMEERNDRPNKHD